MLPKPASYMLASFRLLLMKLRNILQITRNGSVVFLKSLNVNRLFLPGHSSATSNLNQILPPVQWYGGPICCKHMVLGRRWSAWLNICTYTCTISYTKGPGPHIIWAHPECDHTSQYWAPSLKPEHKKISHQASQGTHVISDSRSRSYCFPI